MNLLALVQQITGAEYEFASRRDNGEFAGPCPFCGGEDRFRVWPNRAEPGWWCRGCDKKGGSIVLMTEYYQIPYHDAVQQLSDMGFIIDSEPAQATKKKVSPPTKRDFSELEVDIDTVEYWYITGRDKAFEYYSQWGLTMDDVDRHWLGWHPEKHGYTIPHWWIEGGKTYLKGVKIRHETSDPKRRFSAITGSNNRGVWNMQYISNPDGTREGPILDSLFILEAEKDAALLEGMGYPAIAFFPETAWLTYLQRALHNVVQPVIVFDEDNGRGLERALLIAEQLRTRPAIVSTFAWKIKSPSDLAEKYGRAAVHEWVTSLKLDIEPL